MGVMSRFIAEIFNENNDFHEYWKHPSNNYGLKNRASCSLSETGAGNSNLLHVKNICLTYPRLHP